MKRRPPIGIGWTSAQQAFRVIRPDYGASKKTYINKNARKDPMKIVLVFPPFYLQGMYNLPPLGLINVATSIKNSGHQIVLLDLVLAIRQNTLAMGKNIYDESAEIILGENPDLVAMSAQCTTFPPAIQISKRIRAMDPHVKIVFGGHNVSFTDGATLENFPFIDCMVRGEGETIFPELVEAYANGDDGSGIAGITFHRGQEIIVGADRPLISDLNDLPLPDYSFSQPLHAYRDACELPRSIAILEVGRGCPHRCIYCSESIMWRRRSRTFSIDRLVKEMAQLHRDFGAECFLLAYDQFTARKEFVKSFCQEVIQEGLNHLPWYCISRLDSVDAALLALMREAGCESMCYGIDSGSKRTLAFIRKDIDESILYKRVAETATQGIVPTLSFVIGFPQEEKQDIDDTLRMALRTGILGNSNPLIQMPTLLPGTDLFNRYVKCAVRRVDTYFALGLEFDEGKRMISDEEMINGFPAIFSSFYNLPCPAYPLEELNLLASYFPLMVRFYPKTLLLLSLETHEFIADLFIQWLGWLKDKLKRESVLLTPNDCYLYFKDFTGERLAEIEELTRPYLPDILEYENLSLKVGKPAPRREHFAMEIQDTLGFVAVKNRDVIVKEFDFDVPVIIMDFKAGRFQETYEPQKTLLLFRQEEDILEVVEINAFTRDLLALCDGESPLESISSELYGQYGKDMTREAFLHSCFEAVRILGKEGYLTKGGETHGKDHES